MDTDSILSSVKKTLGLMPEYKPFDDELASHINSALFTLRQLGYGPPEGFRVTGADETWTQFFASTPSYNVDVVTYVGLKVRLVFDPPSSPHVMTAYQEQLKEFEWRFNVHQEEARWTGPQIL